MAHKLEAVAGWKVSAYGQEKTIAEILIALSAEEIEEAFRRMLEVLLQEGRI